MSMIQLPKHLSIIPAQLPAWKVVAIRYFDANKGEGNQSANIYVRAKDDAADPPYVLTDQIWPTGKATKQMERHTSPQIEGDPSGEFAGCDFFMSRDGYRPTPDTPGPYSIRIALAPSDLISGFGIAPNWAHDTYRVEFQWTEKETDPPPPPPSGDYVTHAELAGYRFVSRDELKSILQQVLSGL